MPQPKKPKGAQAPPAQPSGGPGPCPACGGRGTVSFGVDDLQCAACGGTGREAT